MIKFCQVTKGFKTDFWEKSFIVLDNISFTVKKGELTGFLGANGAGKTTSMKVMMDFIRPNGGEIIFSESLGKLRGEIFSKIGYLPERPYFYPHLTGRAFLTYMGKINLVNSNELARRIVEWASRLSIDFALDRKVRDYSKGMLQRLGFISTILHNPEVLILDEPLSGLDPVGRKELKDAIEMLNKNGTTIFFSSHIVSDIEEICSEVIVLESGKVFYQGDLEELIKNRERINYKISYMDLSSGRRIDLKVAELAKRSCIEEIMGKSGDIISIQEERPTLEEIIYKIKS